ncbi:MAG: hypothetical protein CVU09_16505 [Bacteroidetes bacterium HGW-Bacteroidetes-4]|jgi:type IX secretion system PorP/SprF family membrane protein|nr:MAG: hypothetical protein CVU09_16505 [Bacteroidetes bacterium HGW-Bacteroidetes-4]
MTNKTQKILLLFLYLFINIYSRAQDVPYSQHYSNLTYLNPAFAGTRESMRMNLFYRNQWPKSGAGFQSFGAAFDLPIEKFNSGFGVIVTNEMAGAYMQPSVDFIYSYQIKPFPDAYLSMALQGGLVQKYLGEVELQDNNEVLTRGFSKIYPDFAVGITGSYKNFYSGISSDHLMKPYQGVSARELQRINRKYTFFIGYLHSLTGRLIKEQRIISPSVLIQIQGGQQNINWGSSFQYNWLIGGLWLRHNVKFNMDAAILMAGFKTSDMRFAYSYDINVGKKTFVPLGSHEISFTILFDYNKKKQFQAVKCPGFLL